MRSLIPLFAFLPLLLLTGVSNCSRYQVKPDVELSAAASGDETGLVEGCGQQLASGLTLCRKQEGDQAGGSVAFVAPPAHCLGTTPCASFKIYFPDGSPTFGDVIPQGTTRKEVPWETLLKKKTFDLGDRGFWAFTYALKWLGTDGQEHTSFSDGEIILRVYKKGYKPLDQVEGDPNFVWSWIENGVPVRMTTGMRAFVGRK